MEENGGEKEKPMVLEMYEDGSLTHNMFSLFFEDHMRK